MILLKILFLILFPKFIYELFNLIIARFMNYKVWNKLNDKFIIITGATDGIGKEIAILLAKKNKNLILFGRNENKMNLLIENIKKYNIKYYKILKDFSVEQNFNDLPQVPIGMLINNAGMSQEFPEFLEDEKNATKIIMINNLNLVKLTQKVLKIMKSDSYLINIGSTVSEFPCPLLSVYSASKAFVKQFSESLKEENLSKNIFTIHFSPNFVSTKMSRVKPSFFVPTAQVYANCLVNSIWQNNVVPFFPHLLQNTFLFFVPNRIIGIAMLHRGLMIRKKALDKKLKNQ